MVFTSAIFLFLFLPLFLAAYYATPPRFRSYSIFIGSCIFYGWWRVDFLLLVLAISLWSYMAGYIINHCTRKSLAKAMMITAISGILLVLGYFKYANFFLENIGAATGRPFAIDPIILPIGISFHVFQSISYIIDIYRKDAPPTPRLIDFLAFTSLFPQLIAGPVLRYKDLAAQLTARTHNWEKFNRGAERFALGLCCKVLIADPIAPLVKLMFEQAHPTMAEAWLGALSYTFQLYFDFSGYSHMAIGLGLMMGFRFVENFNAPYHSRSITEFWKRWHISLSNWLRDYLYIPLGGNQGSRSRTLINILITMALGGLWHGANWTFILWGFWHGGWMALERFLGIKQKGIIFPAYAARFLTFLLVVIGWVMFRAADVSSAQALYKGMAGLQGITISEATLWQIPGLSLLMLPLAVLFTFLPCKIPAYVLAVGFVLALSRLLAQSYSPFLYFQF